MGKQRAHRRNRASETFDETLDALEARLDGIITQDHPHRYGVEIHGKLRKLANSDMTEPQRTRLHHITARVLDEVFGFEKAAS